jgi:ribosomal protein S18 acetylase RimI-like enzyme
MWQVRPYESHDHDALVAIAERLAEGAAGWRDPARWSAAVRGWVTGSIDRAAQDGAALLVATGAGRVAGFVSVSSRRHFTGDIDAYIGELVVAAGAEGRGAGRALLAAAEDWASRRGYDRLTLETGAANARARAFYARAGYAEEEVRLSKDLSGRLRRLVTNRRRHAGELPTNE